MFLRVEIKVVMMMMMMKIKVARVLGGLAWTSTSVFAIAPTSGVCNPVLRHL